ncbi:MAG TPA: glycine dehydrogenase, partial [Rhodobiaceae bacterium]|nr:glycine dehydrogenase [Rhodobiaceae bacterium]
MRYLPLTDTDRQAMLVTIGAGQIDELFIDVPQAARREGTVELPRHQGE